MSLALNEEQIMLKDAADSFFRERAPVSALRALRDNADETGFSRDLWRAMADMGWPGAFLPEEYGGIGCGFTELGVVLEAGGRTLAASPLFASVALCASALLLAGTEAQKSGYLPRIASGDLLMALAVDEGPHHRPHSVATRAEPGNDGYLLSGRKAHVVDGHVADAFIVVARTSGEADEATGITLFLVDAGAGGVAVERRIMVDSRNMAEVRLENVHVSRADVLGELHDGAALLQQVLDRGNIALCAEMLGSAREAFERTLEYLKQREQFGAIIGTFQALQHRAAIMFCELEMSKSVLMKALRTIDDNDGSLPLMASQAKVQVAETLRLVSDEAIQLHGGIGMTDEEEIGFFLKRARVAQQLLGDEHYHLARYASLRGY